MVGQPTVMLFLCNSSETPTPEVTRLHSHMCPITELFPKPDSEMTILLLIGRDSPQLIKVRESRNGPHNAPSAQRMELGWVIIGDVGLDGTHSPEQVEAYRTHILDNGRSSVCSPCPKCVNVKDIILSHRHAPSGQLFRKSCGHIAYDDGVGSDVYQQTRNDAIMADVKLHRRQPFSCDQGGRIDQELQGNWVDPLPFSDNVKLPNNRPLVINCLQSL